MPKGLSLLRGYATLARRASCRQGKLDRQCAERVSLVHSFLHALGCLEGDNW